jgi:hypothetical protein
MVALHDIGGNAAVAPRAREAAIPLARIPGPVSRRPCNPQEGAKARYQHQGSKLTRRAAATVLDSKEAVQLALNQKLAG